MSETLQETGLAELCAGQRRSREWVWDKDCSKGNEMCQGPQDKKKLGEFERRMNK